VERVCSVSKKVVLFGPYPPPYGGVAIYVYLLHKHLERSQIDCELKAYRPDADLAEDAVHPVFSSVFKNFRTLTGNDVCLDSSTFFFEYLSGKAPVAWFFIKLLKRFRWIKVFHDGSLPSRYDSFQPLQKFYFKVLIRLVDEFIVVSEGLYDWLKNIIKVKQKVTLIRSLLPILPDIVDPNLQGEVEQIHAKYNKIVCSIGVFTPEYGFDQIANAVEQVRKKTGHNIGLLLIDSAFDSNGSHNSYGERILQNREWIAIVRNIPHPQVLQVLRNCDVFVRGFLYESYGLSRIEAIWCDTPVIATNVGETNGMLLYEYGDEEMLTRQIQKALFESFIDDIRSWSDLYKQEAINNLQAIIKVLGVGNKKND